MNNNDILRSIRYLLATNDGQIAKIIQSSGLETSRVEITSYMKWPDQAGYKPCTDKIMAHFLDGLIIHQRGPSTDPPPPPESKITNNSVLKKLRVAFSLKQEDIQDMFVTAGFNVSKSELSALFRNETHPHYRPCGDQFLRHFLKELTLRVRGQRDLPPERGCDG